MRPATVRALPAEGPIPCPRRGCDGEIVEVDQAIRWNPLEVCRDGDEVWLHTNTAGASNWERATPGFICDTCLGPVTLPDPYPTDISYD